MVKYAEGEKEVLLCRVEYLPNLPSNKKNKGKLFLTNQRILFEGEDIQYDVFLNQISCCIANKKSETKVLLRIVRKGENKEEGSTFSFLLPLAHSSLTPSLKLSQKQLQREKFSEHLREQTKLYNERLKRKAQPPSSFPPVKRVKLTKEDEQNKEDIAHILENDTDLKYLYEELVPFILSHNEFCCVRKEFLSSLPPSISSSNPPPNSNKSSQEDGKIHYRITESIIQKIFTEYPEVKLSFSRSVPPKTEEEFWTEYFQSLYFHRSSHLSSLPSSNKRSISSNEILNSQSYHDLAMGRLDDVDPLLNLCKDDNNDIINNNDVLPVNHKNNFNLNLKNEDMLKKINSYATLEVNNPIDVIFGHSKRKQNQNQTIKDQIRIDDLEDDISPYSFPLKISNHRNFFQSNPPSSTPLSSESRAHLLHFTQSINDWNTLHLLPPSPSPLLLYISSDDNSSDDSDGNDNVDDDDEDEYYDVEDDGDKERRSEYQREWIYYEKNIQPILSHPSPSFSPLILVQLIPSHSSEDPSSFFERIYSKEFLVGLRKQYLKSHELLRHFWNSYPISSPAHAEKIKIILKAIESTCKQLLLEKHSLLSSSSLNSNDKAQAIVMLVHSLHFAVSQAKAIHSSQLT